MILSKFDYIWVLAFKFYTTYLCTLIQDWLTIEVTSSQDIKKKKVDCTTILVVFSTFEFNPSTMLPNQ
jgi:hypothetical protein